MRKAFNTAVILFFAFLHAGAQDTLYDQYRVNSVYITISPDSLHAIMADVYSNHYYKTTFVYDYGSGSDTVYDAGFRLRGNTSRVSQKKSFKVSFNEYSPGRRFMGVKKLNLNGQHNDPTLIREKLFYDIWNRAGMPPRRASFVRVYINGSYYGLYTNIEEYDKAWLTRVYNENDGNLYKCTYPASLVYLGADQQTYKDIINSPETGDRAYDLQTNESLDDYSDLVSLITLLDQDADTSFARKIKEKIDVAGVLKAFTIDIATGNWDDYSFLKNNYFLYDHAQSGYFSFITFDTDNTFGVDWFGIDWATRNCLNWYHPSEPRPLITKLMQVPAYYDMFRMYLDTIVHNYTFPDSIFPHIDSLRSLIEDAAIEDTYRTLDYGYTVQDFYDGFTKTVDSHTPYGIKPFLETRYQKIIEQLHPSSNPETDKSAVLVFPNPAIDKIKIHTEKEVLSELSLIDSKGVEVVKIHGGPDVLIDVSGLPRGIYILKWQRAKMRGIRKVILQ